MALLFYHCSLRRRGGFKSVEPLSLWKASPNSSTWRKSFLDKESEQQALHRSVENTCTQYGEVASEYATFRNEQIAVFKHKGELFALVAWPQLRALESIDSMPDVALLPLITCSHFNLALTCATCDCLQGQSMCTHGRLALRGWDRRYRNRTFGPDPEGRAENTWREHFVFNRACKISQNHRRNYMRQRQAHNCAVPLFCCTLVRSWWGEDVIVDIAWDLILIMSYQFI